MRALASLGHAPAERGERGRVDVRVPSLSEETHEEALQLAPEHGARQQIDEDVARVVRHADLLYYRPHEPVAEVTLPLAVGGALRRVESRVADGEGEVDAVADGDGQHHDDEVEGDGEEHDGGRRGVRRLVALRQAEPLLLGARDLARLVEDEHVED